MVGLGCLAGLGNCAGRSGAGNGGRGGNHACAGTRGARGTVTGLTLHAVGLSGGGGSEAEWVGHKNLTGGERVGNNKKTTGGHGTRPTATTERRHRA